MTASSSIHSRAFNFLSFVTTGTDPRTGQYTCSLSLPELSANDLCGPNIPLRLGYNPLNTFDSGFGKGWNLQLTQFDTLTLIVSLASGETFKVTDTSSSDGRYRMDEQKIESFQLYKLDEGYFRVIHKSGLIEDLRTAANDTVALPERIVSPQGHHVALAYSYFASGRMLKSIAHADGRGLLDITRGNNQVQVRLHPRTAAEALFSLVLQGSENRVARVELPTSNLASWRFEYAVLQGLLCIARVEGPLGGHEQIVYDDGHLFPGPDNRRLPRVVRHLRDPGAGQPPIDTRYEYDDFHNFLGHNAPGLIWDDSGKDNLYQVLSDYQYWTREHLWDASPDVDAAKRTIERTFNRFHLITREETRQGDCVKRVSTDYHIVPGKRFEEQPPQVQLPASVTNAWYLHSEQGRLREDVVQHAYDEHGNETLLVHANGITETSEYYKATGEAGCPADPHGFVRHLKSKTVTPASTDVGTAPALRTEYTYIEQPPVTGGGYNWVAQDRETLVQVQGNVELQRTRQHYLVHPGDPFQHGRVAQTEVILNNKGTYTNFFYSKVAARRADETVMRTVEVLSTNFDKATKTITRERSLLNGQALLELDDNDVEIAYRYDLLGRVIEETVAPGSNDFKASRHYSYILVAQRGNQASQTAIDVKGVATRSDLDGLQRVIEEWRQDVDGDPVGKAFRRVQAARYDAFGQLLESDEIDWLCKDDMTLTSSYTYDDWGEQNSVTGPDGVTEHSLNDPVRFQVQKWREGMGSTVTVSNRFEKPDSVTRIGLDGKQLSRYEYFYDGLGRTHHEYDELDHFRYYQYDAFDRMTLSGLPDQSRVERRYASHSAEDLPVWIAVSNDKEGLDQVVLGEQSFDGLERLTSATTGGRTRTYQFNEGERQPASVTTHAGHVIEYDYNLHLGEDPVQRRLQGGATADYQYDRDNAQLTFSKENDQSLSCTYFSNGELKQEVRGDGRDTWEMNYEYSLRSRLISYSDAFGQLQSYHYDDSGRLQCTVLGDTTSTFCYNATGRVERIFTEAADEGHSVQIDLKHDDFAREILRTFTFDDGSVQTLEQGYNARDMLELRILKLGTTLLRNERYVYDPRGRLTEYYCEGSERPLDPYGKEIAEQHFTFDALDNMREVITRFPDGEENIATYDYEYDDPVQLSAVRNSHADYPALIALIYDEDGNLVIDDQGRTLAYDALGRLATVSEDGQVPLEYRYDAQDILSGSLGGEGAEQRFYRGGELVNQLQEGVQRTFMRGGETILAERIGGGADVLLATDVKKTVLAERDASTRGGGYTVHGYRSVSSFKGNLGFNGEALESSDVYLLGSYRAYNPGLMIMHSPDTLSPFARGGLNAYAYCLGDPVNLVDPTGHLPGWVLPAIGVGLSLSGVGLTVASGVFAASASASGGLFALQMTSVATGVMGGVTGAASGMMQMMMPEHEAGNILGYVSIGLGAASLATGLGALGMQASHQASRQAGRKVSETFQRRLSSTDSLDNLGIGSLTDHGVHVTPSVSSGSLQSLGAIDDYPGVINQFNTSGIDAYAGSSSSVVGTGARNPLVSPAQVKASGSAPNRPPGIGSGSPKPPVRDFFKTLSKSFKARSQSSLPPTPNNPPGYGG
ncbi:RHS repeat domain-containing protein [Pseudomonas wadenswilerensis]